MAEHRNLEKQQLSQFNESLPYVAWTIALGGFIGSLFFSEFMDLPPCDLCWYQRIALYPLVLILPVGIVRRDPNLKLYSLPLTLVGLAIAIYHNLLYYGIIPQELTPCSEGVPCTAKQLELFGFLTIPLMSLLAFAATAVCLGLFRSQTADAPEVR